MSSVFIAYLSIYTVGWGSFHQEPARTHLFQFGLVWFEKDTVCAITHGPIWNDTAV